MASSRKGGHINQMLDASMDVSKERRFGLRWIKKDEIVHLRSVLVPSAQIWLVLKGCYFVMHTYRERLDKTLLPEGQSKPPSPTPPSPNRSRILKFRSPSAPVGLVSKSEEDLKPDPEAFPPFRWQGAKNDLKSPFEYIKRLETAFAFVESEGMEETLMEQLKVILDRDIMVPKKMEVQSLGAAHLCQYLVDVYHSAKHYKEVHEPEPLELAPAEGPSSELQNNTDENQNPPGSPETPTPNASSQAATKTGTRKKQASRVGRTKRIFMIGVDGSRLSYHTFRVTMDLVREWDQVIVCHSYVKEEIGSLPKERRPETISLRYRSELRHHSCTPDYTVLCQDRPGRVSAKEHVCNIAMHHKVEILAVGLERGYRQHGGKFAKAKVLGSTSDLSLRRAFCTSLLVKPDSFQMGRAPQHFLVHIDGTDESHEVRQLNSPSIFPDVRFLIRLCKTWHRRSRPRKA